MRSKDERGASAVEYGLLIALFALALVVSAWAFQNTIEAVFEETACDESNGYDCDGAVVLTTVALR